MEVKPNPIEVKSIRWVDQSSLDELLQEGRDGAVEVSERVGDSAHSSNTCANTLVKMHF